MPISGLAFLYSVGFGTEKVSGCCCDCASPESDSTSLRGSRKCRRGKAAPTCSDQARDNSTAANTDARIFRIVNSSYNDLKVSGAHAQLWVDHAVTRKSDVPSDAATGINCAGRQQKDSRGKLKMLRCQLRCCDVVAGLSSRQGTVRTVKP